MARPANREPTEGELAILQVLWQKGPSTVREVHQRLCPGGSVAYTTILKLLQIMHEKGLVMRDTSARSHVYAARSGEEQTQRRLVQRLMDRAFGGSAARLVQGALSAKPATVEELAAIRRMLDAADGGAS